MILDKHPLPDDPTPVDAPPSYETLGASPSSSSSANRDYKTPLVQPQAGPSRSISSAPLQSPSLKSPSDYSSHSSPASPNKGKGKDGNWFPFTKSPEARRAQEVRQTVLSLVRGLIEEHNSASSPAVAGILHSCSEACADSSLSLAMLLQEKSIEEHTPLYWTIVKRLPDTHEDVAEQQGPDLLSALISYASPLTKATITDLRLACLATSDQVLFQRLRLSPEFAPVSALDRVLLGVTIQPDEIEVEDLPGDLGAFAVNMTIPHFHKRMVVTKEIAVEFIARSRMWRLAFFIASEQRTSFAPPVGSWCISVCLLETSPPTFLNSRVVIQAAKSSPLPKSPTPPPSPTRPPIGSFRSKESLKPLSIPLVSRDPLQPGSSRNQERHVVVSLQDKKSGADLQYEKSPYVGGDETLRARLEARLEKPGNTDGDCMIC